MPELQVPTVTEADLRKFHVLRFGASFPHTRIMSQPDIYGQQHEEGYDDEDGLGYYPDGEKRTLTDEQINMFRHSEIQTLLREKRQREEKEQEHARNARDKIAASAPPAVGNLAPKGGKIGKTGKATSVSPDSDDEEYQRFLQAERQEFNKAAAQKRNGERLAYVADDRTISTRRRVREMDSFQATSDVLMYEDEPSSPKRTGQASAAQAQGEEKVEGRKIWFPKIG